MEPNTNSISQPWHHHLSPNRVICWTNWATQAFLPFFDIKKHVCLICCFHLESQGMRFCSPAVSFGVTLTCYFFFIHCQAQKHINRGEIIRQIISEQGNVKIIATLFTELNMWKQCLLKMNRDANWTQTSLQR